MMVLRLVNFRHTNIGKRCIKITNKMTTSWHSILYTKYI